MKGHQLLRGILKWALILISVFALLCAGFLAILTSAFGDSGKVYSVTELKQCFENKEPEIYELKRFFISIVPEGYAVDIELDGSKIERLSIDIMDTAAHKPNGNLYTERNLETSNPRKDKLFKILGWTDETIAQLEEKLDAAQCIGIMNGEPAHIAFQRSGMGIYSFVVFDRPIPNNLKAQYNDSCTYLLAGERLVLEYGGGAIGPQCFYNKN